MTPIQLDPETGLKYFAFVSKMDGYAEGVRAGTEYAKRMYLAQLLQSQQKGEQLVNGTAAEPANARANEPVPVAQADATGSTTGSAADGDAAGRTGDGSAELPRDGSAAEPDASAVDAESAATAAAAASGVATVDAKPACEQRTDVHTELAVPGCGCFVCRRLHS